MPRDAMVDLLMQCYDEARAPTVTEVHDSNPQLYRVKCTKITSHAHMETDDEGDPQEPVVQLSSMTQTLNVEIHGDNRGCPLHWLNRGKMPHHWLCADCPFVLHHGSELTIVNSIEKHMPTKRVRSD